mgnify:CR=1 FL=1
MTALQEWISWKMMTLTMNQGKKTKMTPTMMKTTIGLTEQNWMPYSKMKKLKKSPMLMTRKQKLKATMKVKPHYQNMEMEQV